jgi:hypothetical protein
MFDSHVQLLSQPMKRDFSTGEESCFNKRQILVRKLQSFQIEGESGLAVLQSAQLGLASLHCPPQKCDPVATVSERLSILPRYI